MKDKLPKERLTWLHEHILGGSYPNAARLSEQFGISLRQAGRDFECLRHGLGAPVEYDHTRRGYRYTQPFTLPDSVRSDDSENIVAAVAAADPAEEGGVQLSIPYDAQIEVYDRLTQLELGKFIVGRGKGKNIYRCEFRNPEFFIGMIVATGKKVRIVSPDWLRERLTELCDKASDANR